MNEKIYPVTDAPLKTHLNLSQYQQMYKESIEHPQAFWGKQSEKFISWTKPWNTVMQGDFQHGNLEWYAGGKLNACYNCLDRHLPQSGDKTALLWEGNDPQQSQKITYNELYEQVCRFANVLKKWGIKKGDRVCIYMPMIPEVVVAMLACARIGAIHSVVFGGFSSEAIRNRILDADCSAVITADYSFRANKMIPLKANVDLALKDCPSVKTVLVVKRDDKAVDWLEGRDHWWQEEIQTVSADCPCEEMDASDPLFILYTSGSTGKPKGILHATGGYLVYAASTHYYVFDYHEDDIYWCTADVGWITGHSYIVYGPLCNGATSVIFEGVPDYPSAARYWEIVDKYAVNVIYTSPTAIRALRRDGDQWLNTTRRDSLRILGTVGEPINPDVWEWYYEKVGKEHCPIVDTWWQTETGGILISALPGVTPLKAGSASWPLFGIKPAIVNDEGKSLPFNILGKLVITQPWPGMAKTIYGNPERFFEAYFKDFPGYYLTGDNAHCDEQGYYWITGRNDDVLKISGHRIGTAEVENALLESPLVAEAAVVPVPHEIKGEAIYAFITLKAGVKGDDAVKQTLTAQVRSSIGGLAAPEYIQWAEALPKTRSGKIMRRLLRKIANQDLEDLGDTTTLADPQVVDRLIKERIKT